MMVIPVLHVSILSKKIRDYIIVIAHGAITIEKFGERVVLRG